MPEFVCPARPSPRSGLAIFDGLGARLDSYDDIPYDSTPVTETDPDRLAVTARLFGVEAADARTCRVLELGCAAGGNLIPLAVRYPHSRFLGVELSARQVEEGRALVGRLGLDNVEIRQADILALGDDIGEFDYILCHGVYSWVPDEVRDKILALCAGHLAPAGVAYISYNTLPGWRMRGMLRDMLLYHTREETAPAARLARAQEFLDLFSGMTSGLETPHLHELRRQIERIREAHPSYLFHEYLEAFNEPQLFSDFMRRAEARGLAYLGDTELHTMFPSALDDAVEEALAGIQDAVEQEQYLDFIRNRSFRQTLLCRAEALPDRVLDLERFESFAFFADLAPPPKLDLRRPKPQSFRRVDGEQVKVAHPLTKATIAHLGRRYPDSVSFAELSDTARRAVAGGGGAGHAGELEHLFGELFSLYLHQAVGASLSAETLPRGGSRPRAADLARAQVEAGLGHLASVRHTTLSLDPVAVLLVGLLDGERDLDGLVEAVTQRILEARDEVPEWTSLPTDPRRLGEQVRRNCARLLALFDRQGVLVA